MTQSKDTADKAIEKVEEYLWLNNNIPIKNTTTT